MVASFARSVKKRRLLYARGRVPVARQKWVIDRCGGERFERTLRHGKSILPSAFEAGWRCVDRSRNCRYCVDDLLHRS